MMRTPARRIAITPIIAGRALKGPAADMLRHLGHEVSALGVARLYSDLVDVFVLDEADGDLKPSIESLGMRVFVTDTVMKTAEDKRRLAETVMIFASRL
jgi:LPPG:FO 2-phospho-L-lactate transferase